MRHWSIAAMVALGVMSGIVLVDDRMLGGTMWAGAANAAEPGVAAVGDDRSDDAADLEGFWPTSGMIDSVVRRWALEAADKYELRPAQHKEVEAKLLTRWKTFLDENRHELQPLINDYLETRLAVEPPTADEVAQWAARAMPVFDSFRKTLEEGEEEVRELLTPAQRVKFEQERVKRQLGMRLFQSNLKRWSVGSFAQREWWDPPRGYKDKTASAVGGSGGGGPGGESSGGGGAGGVGSDKGKAEASVDRGPGDLPERVTLELDAWEAYVNDFCDKYDLDRSQRNAAASILKEMMARAVDHVTLHRVEIAEVERMIAHPEGVDQDELDKKLAAAYGPMDRMFAELEERIERLPTRGQRQRAGEGGER